jgi:hypothetical protein
MYGTNSTLSTYVQRVGAIRSRVQELGREIAIANLDIRIDSELLILPRTSHSVTIASGACTQSVMMTKEEFFDEYCMFEVRATPKLRAAIREIARRHEMEPATRAAMTSDRETLPLGK